MTTKKIVAGSIVECMHEKLRHESHRTVVRKYMRTGQRYKVLATAQGRDDLLLTLEGTDPSPFRAWGAWRFKEIEEEASQEEEQIEEIVDFTGLSNRKVLA